MLLQELECLELGATGWHSQISQSLYLLFFEGTSCVYEIEVGHWHFVGGRLHPD